MLSFLYYWLCEFFWFVWCCLTDYGLYVCVDFLARRWLKFASNDDERNVIWRYMCLLLTIISIPISYYHHYTVFLWILINVTLLLTIRTSIIQKFAAVKSGCVKMEKFLKYYYERLTTNKSTSINLKPSFVPLQMSPATEIYRNRTQNDASPIAQRFQNGPNLKQPPVQRVVAEERDDYEIGDAGRCLVVGENFRKSLSPADRFVRNPLRPISSFESSGYGSPTVVSTPLTDTPPVFRRNVSPSGKFATSTPVDQWQTQRDTYRLGY